MASEEDASKDDGNEEKELRSTRLIKIAANKTTKGPGRRILTRIIGE